MPSLLLLKHCCLVHERLKEIEKNSVKQIKVRFSYSVFLTTSLSASFFFGPTFLSFEIHELVPDDLQFC